MDIEQAKLMVKKSEETGIPVGVGFKMRNEAVFAKAKELIGEVGKILSVTVVKNQPQSPNPAKAWVKETGCMYELSVHDYDLIHYIMGAYPVTVSAKLGYRHGWNREDQAYLTVEYDNGAVGLLNSTYTTTASWTYQDISITFVGENGYMRVERPNRIVLATKTQRVVDVEPLDGEEPFRIELEGFVNSLIEKTEFRPDVHDGAITTLLVESANISHKEGRPVAL
jgi:predicted dehydrogenase